MEDKGGKGGKRSSSAEQRIARERQRTNVYLSTQEEASSSRETISHSGGNGPVTVSLPCILWMVFGRYWVE